MTQEIDVSSKGHPFQKHWQFCIGSGHAPLTLRADSQELLARLHRELGISYVRFHGVLSDDMGVVNTFADLFPLRGGERFSEYNFRRIAASYDGILKAGMKPFVELSFMPEKIAADPSKRCFFYYRDKNVISLPKDDAAWTDLITAFVQFLLARYGKEEVESWYFEVWNEPDLSGFFAGTKEDYFHLYEITARAIKAVDEGLQVGGPATSCSKWVHGFLAFCKENKVPVDFVSTHQYAGDPVGMIDVEGKSEAEEKPEDFSGFGEADLFAGVPDGSVLDALRHMMPDPSETKDLPDDVFRTNARIVREQIARSGVQEKDGGPLPLFYTEWSENAVFSAWTNDTRKEAAYLVRAALDTEGVIDASSVWCASDIFEEFHLFREEFHGGFGLLTQSGIEKPSFWAMKLLSILYGERIDLPAELSEGEIGVAAFRGPDHALQVLLYRQKMKNEDLPEQSCEIILSGLANPSQVTLQRIDETHGNPLAAWKKLGSPAIPTPKEVEEIRSSSRVVEEPLPYQLSEGKLSFQASLGVNDVWLVTIR